MVVTEAMLVSMEELQRHAGDMENHVKTTKKNCKHMTH